MLIQEVYVPTRDARVVDAAVEGVAAFVDVETERERKARLALAASLRLHEHALTKQRRVRVSKDGQRRDKERRRAKLLREWAALEVLERTLPPSAEERGVPTAADLAEMCDQREARATAALRVEREDLLAHPQPRYVTVGGEPQSLSVAMARNPRLRHLFTAIPTRNKLRVWLRPRQGCEPPPGSVVDLEGRTVAPFRSYASIMHALGAARRRTAPPPPLVAACDRALSPAAEQLAAVGAAGIGAPSSTTTTSAAAARQRGSAPATATIQRRRQKLGAKVQLQEQIQRLQRQGMGADEEQKRVVVTDAEASAVAAIVASMARERSGLDFDHLPFSEFDDRTEVWHDQEAARAALTAHAAKLRVMVAAGFDLQAAEVSGRRQVRKTEELMFNIVIADFAAAVAGVHETTTQRMLREGASRVAGRLECDPRVALIERLVDTEALRREELVVTRAHFHASLTFQKNWCLHRNALAAALCGVLVSGFHAAVDGAAVIASAEATARGALYASEDHVKATTIRNYQRRQRLQQQQSAGRRAVIAGRVEGFRAIRLEAQHEMSRAVMVAGALAPMFRTLHAAVDVLEGGLRRGVVARQARARGVLEVVHEEIVRRRALENEAAGVVDHVRLHRAEAAHRRALYAAADGAGRALFAHGEAIARDALAGPMLDRLALVLATARRDVFPVNPHPPQADLLFASEAAARKQLHTRHARAVTRLEHRRAISIGSAALTTQHRVVRDGVLAEETFVRALHIEWLSRMSEEGVYRRAIAALWFEKLVQFVPYQAHLRRRYLERCQTIERFGLETTAVLQCQESAQRRMVHVAQRRRFVRIAWRYFSSREQAGRRALARMCFATLQEAIVAWTREGVAIRTTEQEGRVRGAIVRQMHRGWGRVALHARALLGAHLVFRDERAAFQRVGSVFLAGLEAMRREQVLNTEGVDRLALARALALTVGPMHARAQRARRVGQLHAGRMGFAFAPPSHAGGGDAGTPGSIAGLFDILDSETRAGGA